MILTALKISLHKSQLMHMIATKIQRPHRCFMDTYISARINDSNKIPTAIPMFTEFSYEFLATNFVAII